MIEQGLNVVAGVDLGDKHSHVCLIDLDGNVVERKKLRTSPAAFERYFGGWVPSCWITSSSGCSASRRSSGSWERAFFAKASKALLSKRMSPCKTGGHAYL